MCPRSMPRIMHEDESCPVWHVCRITRYSNNPSAPLCDVKLCWSNQVRLPSAPSCLRLPTHLLPHSRVHQHVQREILCSLTLHVSSTLYFDFLVAAKADVPYDVNAPTFTRKTDGNTALLGGIGAWYSPGDRITGAIGS